MHIDFCINKLMRKQNLARRELKFATCACVTCITHTTKFNSIYTYIPYVIISPTESQMKTIRQKNIRL